MRITALTPTRNRPQAFALLECYMQSQSRRPDRWLVINDGDPYFLGECSIARVQFSRPTEGDTMHSFLHNMLTGLEMITDRDPEHVVLFMEDDEWYSPNYIALMAEMFKLPVQMVGVRPARYYDVRRRVAKQLVNKDRASLANMGITADLIPTMIELIKEKKTTFIDLEMWKKDVRKQLLHNDKAPALTIGMKCLPGTPGIGMGHRNMEGSPDPDMAILREWMGPFAEDAQLYKEMFDAPRGVPVRGRS